MRFSFSSRLLRFGVALFLALQAKTALAEAPRACVEAVERGQSLRDKVKLLQAKAAFLACAASTCPEVIQRDCAQWIAELETRIPTVIVTASDSAGKDVVYVRVLVDGEHFVDRLDGIAVPMDPGIHVFRFEPANGPPLEQTVVIREAEKYQKQHFTLPAPPRTPAPASAPASSAILAAPPPPRVEQVASEGSGWKTGTIVAASIAAVATASFAGFGIAGAIDEHHLNDSCSPRCGPSSVDTDRHLLQTADVSLGVGVAALAVATWLYFEWRARPNGPPPGVGTGTLVLRF
jgi:hypothetical protein